MQESVPAAWPHSRVKRDAVVQVCPSGGIDASDDNDRPPPEEPCQSTGTIGVVEGEPRERHVGSENGRVELRDAPLSSPVHVADVKRLSKDGPISRKQGRIRGVGSGFS